MEDTRGEKLAPIGRLFTCIKAPLTPKLRSPQFWENMPARLILTLTPVGNKVATVMTFGIRNKKPEKVARRIPENCVICAIVCSKQQSIWRFINNGRKNLWCHTLHILEKVPQKCANSSDSITEGALKRTYVPWYDDVGYESETA